VVVHEPRHEDVWHPHAGGRPQIEELVAGHLGFQRPVLVVAPFRQQAIEPDRVDHCARQDMGSDLGPLLHHDDGEFGALLGRKLPQPDRRRQPGRSGPDDHDIELHRFALGQVHGRSSSLDGRFARLWRVFHGATRFGGVAAEAAPDCRL
jgi:hypothetical protein